MNYSRESPRSWMASEIADMFDDLEEHGHLNKRPRLWSFGTNLPPMKPVNYNLLDEPSPLEQISFMKNPSLLEPMQMQTYESGYSNAVSATGSGIMNLEAADGLLNKRSMLWSSGTSSSPLQLANYSLFDELNRLGQHSLMKNPSLYEPIQRQPYESGYSEAAHCPLNKQSMLWSSETSSSPMQPTNYNLLGELSPLGQHSLMKNPSLLESIQTQPYESGYSEAVTLKADGAGFGTLTAASVETTMRPRSIEKLKASNFPATLLKIGQWEFKSRNVGGLVAKFYFARRKLVWEVMEQGLKSKIEIEWSNIIALKTNCPQDGPGTLTLVLAKKPLFFQESKPMPKKQTMWHKASDFTYGQASMNRQHILQCDQGIMNKHIEKLVQCDLRLFHLCHQPEIVIDSPYFDVDPSNESKGHPSIFGTQTLASPVEAQSSSKHMYKSNKETSPNSVIDVRANEGNGRVNTRNTMDCGQKEVKGLEQSDWFDNSTNITGASEVEEWLKYTNLYQ